jgi:hypothetical protein
MEKYKKANEFREILRVGENVAKIPCREIVANPL